jgi:hypothetical protein
MNKQHGYMNKQEMALAPLISQDCDSSWLADLITDIY